MKQKIGQKLVLELVGADYLNLGGLPGFIGHAFVPWLICGCHDKACAKRLAPGALLR
jgi:hypothetical protein